MLQFKRTTQIEDSDSLDSFFVSDLTDTENDTTSSSSDSETDTILIHQEVETLTWRIEELSITNSVEKKQTEENLTTEWSEFLGSEETTPKALKQQTPQPILNYLAPFNQPRAKDKPTQQTEKWPTLQSCSATKKPNDTQVFNYRAPFNQPKAKDKPTQQTEKWPTLQTNSKSQKRNGQN